VVDLNAVLFRGAPDALRAYWHNAAFGFWLYPDIFDRLDRELGGAVTAAAERLLRSQPEVLGISVNNTSITFTVGLISWLRNHDFTGAVILGGPGIRANPTPGRPRYPLVVSNLGNDSRESCEQAHARLYALCQVLVCGEGERTVLAVLDRLEGRLAEPVQGAWFTADDPALGFRARPQIEHLDQLPLASYPGVSFGAVGYREVHLLANRGCIRRCNFCAERRLWPGYRSRSPEHIVAELTAHRQRHGVIVFQFADLLLNGNLPALRRLGELLVSADLGLHLSANLTVHPGMRAEDFLLLRAAGFEQFTFGIESCSPRVLADMNKRFTLDQAEATLRWCTEAGLRPLVNFIVGYPTESEADFEESLAFLTRNRTTLGGVNVLGTCLIFKDSDLFQRREALGITTAEPVDKVSALVYWRNSIAGDYTTRLGRLLRFAERCRELGIPYPAAQAALIGDLDTLLGLTDLPAGTKLARRAALESGLVAAGLSFEGLDEGTYLALERALHGSPLEVDAAVNHLVLAYEPGRHEDLYEALFGGRLIELDAWQDQSRPLLLHVARKWGIDGLHLVKELFVVPQAHLRFLAFKAVGLVDLDQHLLHYTALCATFENLEADTHALLAEECAACRRWVEGDYQDAGLFDREATLELLLTSASPSPGDPRDLCAALARAGASLDEADLAELHVPLHYFLHGTEPAKLQAFSLLLAAFRPESAVFFTALFEERLGRLDFFREFYPQVFARAVAKAGFPALRPYLLGLLSSPHELVRFSVAKVLLHHEPQALSTHLAPLFEDHFFHTALHPKLREVFAAEKARYDQDLSTLCRERTNLG